MRINYDSSKNRRNIEKHGVSFVLAHDLEWDSLLALEDRRKDYGEIRMIGYALIRTRLYCEVFTDRGTERRIVSLRKANAREVALYGSRKNALDD